MFLPLRALIDFAFYVNKNGWRTGGPKNKDDVRWRITWEGSPTNFGMSPPSRLLPSHLPKLTPRSSPPPPRFSALHYPWVLAFDPNFVEIWNVNTGVFTQVIQGSNVRLLFADTPPSAVNSAAQLQQQQMHAHQRLAYARGQPPYGQYAQQQQQMMQQQYGQNGMRGMPPQQMRPPPPPPPPNPRSAVVLSIDERVVTVKLATD